MCKTLYIAFFYSLVFILFINHCVVMAKSEQDVKTFMTSLEKQHGKTDTLAVHFDQLKFFSFMDEPIHTKGQMFFAAPGKVRFELLSPYRSLILDDGHVVHRFEYEKEQWEQVVFGSSSSIKRIMGQMSSWLQGKFASQKNIFNFSVSYDDPNSYALLILAPQEKRFKKYIESICIHIGNPPELRIAQIDIHEPGGDYTTMIFYDERINPEIPEAIFKNPRAEETCRRIFSQGVKTKSTQSETAGNQQREKK